MNNIQKSNSDVSAENGTKPLVSGIPTRTAHFRGQQINGDGWTYGSLVIDSMINKAAIIDWADIEVGFVSYSIEEVKPETVGQFTGLVDIHTKRAYKGDIIERDASNGKGKVKGIIVFENGQFRVNWLDKNKGWNNLLYIQLEDSKIIGNVHDNPELLG